MRDNGERIYLGLMEQEDMHKLETENEPPREADFGLENNEYKLSNLVEKLMVKKADMGKEA